MNILKKFEVARNPSTPPEVLTKLAEDKTLSLRCVVAANPSTPQQTLIQLAEDEYWGIRVRVAKNPSTKGETLVRLHSDANSMVKKSVTQNPNLLKYFQTKAEKDGVCTAGQLMPTEWLKQMYLT